MNVEQFDGLIDQIKELTANKDFADPAYDESVSRLWAMLFPGAIDSIQPTDIEAMITARLTIGDYVAARDGE